SPLAARHVDTGMGFERVAGIYATTKGFTDFSADPSNYAADVFAPLFAKIAVLSGKTYARTVPTKREGLTEQEQTDVAFRVLADHARTISCAIADGILPGNEGRNYVIRRILRRGILYGKKLGLATGFFEQLVTPVVESLGHVFPELKQQEAIIRRVIRSEEESFGRTLDRGLQIFTKATAAGKISGASAFELYDTYGFPLDMTQLLATERGLTVDTAEFEKLMEQQRERARAAQKKEIVVAATEGEATDIKPTRFIGYTETTAHAHLLEVLKTEKDAFLVFDQTPFYAEMGGQAGDSGTATIGDRTLTVVDCLKDKSGRHLHKLAPGSELPAPGSAATLAIDATRRRAISRHHSAAHLIHWALRKVLGTHVRQAGTSKTADRLRFDFSHFEAATPEQLREIEQLVNAKVIENGRVEAYETEFDKKPADTLAFFGDKYGKIVRVVDIGGYSRELCGGTHVATTGEIGVIKIVAEMAIAAGTRRIEAVAGAPAYALLEAHEAALKAVGSRLNAGPQDVVQKLDALLAAQKDLEKKLKVFEQKAAAGLAEELAAQAVVRDGLKFVSAAVTVSEPEALRSLGSQVLARLGEGVVTLGAAFGEKTSLVAFCSPAAIKAGHQAGKLIGTLAGQLGGKGGGKPDFAMGGGKEAAKLPEVMALK
ncbi:MAG: alanine--tRNA ligase, partial [Opitutaceae bacterium]|nr:alanine--tRNA ligase [Opitutaceae bacterium]